MKKVERVSLEAVHTHTHTHTHNVFNNEINKAIETNCFISNKKDSSIKLIAEIVIG